MSNVSRRDFLKTGAAALAGITIAPSSILGKSFGHVAPSDKLNIAAVGIGGMGHANILHVKDTENIVALCDVDWKYAKGVFDEFPNAKRYWDLLTIWTNYLAEYGQDPENQLCTDDFAGHWAHNANLSVKAIMGVAAYSEMAKMLGMDEVAETYMTKARNMAKKWMEMAGEGDHYRLAFDRPNTWSQKYNMVWDKMWGLNLFPGVMEKELKYYLTKQNPFGLPLDSRKEYTKSDWIMWTASMSEDMETFQQFINPLYKYVNETTTRVPISDWHHTDSGEWVGFRARSVIGGYWMKVLMDKMQEKQ